MSVLQAPIRWEGLQSALHAQLESSLQYLGRMLPAHASRVMVAHFHQPMGPLNALHVLQVEYLVQIQQPVHHVQMVCIQVLDLLRAMLVVEASTQKRQKLLHLPLA